MAPVITPPLVPAQGKIGDTVTVNGSGFTTAATVNFGSVLASTTFVSSTQLTFVVPSGAPCSGTVQVSVTQTGVKSNPVSFVILPAPSVTSVTPACLPAATGGSVTVTGSGFASGGTINLPTTPTPTALTITPPVNNNAVSGTIPGGSDPGTYQVTVTTPGGTGTPNVAFVTLQAAPALTSVVPPTGDLPGDQVTIYGSDLDNLVSVTYTVGATTLTDTTATAFGTYVLSTVPTGLPAGAGTITVTTCGGSDTIAFN
ncbi:IPT/TIG domain-containing protein [Streptomyces antimycoticus]|uniref:IPT/TIG domain-containing protein n=1 Tax=Streptomyces antimycoticus TaxID=68175 RepID=UPI0036CDD044